MIIFLIQKQGSELFFDQCQTIYSLITKSEWYYDKQINYECLSLLDLDKKDLSNYKYAIPVGSIHFCKKLFLKMNIKEQIPINIPDELNNDIFLGRYVINNTLSGFANLLKNTNFKEKLFVKPKNSIKLFTGTVIENENQLNLFLFDLKDKLETEVLVSSYIEILSEWRFIIYNGEILSIGFYSGDIEIFPNINLVKNMIKYYSKSPICYCMDVCVNENNETLLIEINDIWGSAFYSSNNEMLLKAYKERIIQIKNE